MCPGSVRGGANVADRHRSLAATIQWSIDLLTEPDVDVLEALSVCRGFDVDTAIAVTGRDEVEASIGRLIDASLIVALPADRFRLLEPVRQHAERRLHEREAFDLHAERLAHYSSLVARRSRHRFYTDPTAHVLLRNNIANVEQSLSWLLEHDGTCEAIELIGAVGDYWFTEDQVSGLRWLALIEPRLDDCEPATSAHARLALAIHRQGSGESCAIPQLVEALHVFEQVGRRGAATKAAFWLGRELALGGQRPVDEARPAMLHALELAKHVNDPVLISWSLIWLALIDQRSGNTDSAETHFTAALDVARSAGALHPVGSAAVGLATLARRRGDVAQARRLAALGLAANRAFGDSWQQVGQLLQQAGLCLDDRDLTNAALHFDEAASLAIQVGDRGQLAEAVAVGAVLLDALGMSDAAVHAAAAAQHWWPLGDGHHAPALGAILRPLGNMEQSSDTTVGQRTIRAELRAVMNILDAEPHRTSTPPSLQPPPT